MKCEKCKKAGSTKSTYTNRTYCDSHFMEMISRRIRKDLRVSQKIDIKKEYGFARSTSHETAIAKHFLSEIFGGRLKLSKNSPNAIMPRSLDKEVKEFLEEFLENKESKQHLLNPLRTVLEEEIKEICRILGIRYPKNNETNEILESIEEKYPGTKFSLMKSMKEIKPKNKK